MKFSTCHTILSFFFFFDIFFAFQDFPDTYFNYILIVTPPDFLDSPFYYILAVMQDFFGTSFLILYLFFWIFLVPCFLMFFLSTFFIYKLHLKIFLIPYLLIRNIWHLISHIYFILCYGFSFVLISIFKAVFTFMDHDIFSFQLSSLFATLLTIAPFSMNIYWNFLHW